MNGVTFAIASSLSLTLTTSAPSMEVPFKAFSTTSSAKSCKATWMTYSLISRALYVVCSRVRASAADISRMRLERALT